MDTSKINHPPHYTAAPIECIEAIEAALGKEAFIDFCRGQAIKYLWRARLKDTLQENLLKAQWYIHKALLEIKQ
jgi:hypothetical protein